MSRPSRGFSVAKCAPTSAPTCPASAQLTVDVVAPDEFDIDTDWSPPVTVVTLSFFGRINGGAEFPITIVGPITPVASIILNPLDYGSPGDTFGIRAIATDVFGCNDFVSNTVDTVIPS